MFGFKKKTAEYELVGVADGKVVAIETVKDPVFSQKMMGDGLAIEPTSNKIYACGDGEVTMLFPSNHAVGLLLNNGMEILIHVGIDTVNENGQGFTGLCKQGDKIKAGQPLIEFDRDYLLGKGYDLTVMIIFTKADAYKSFERKENDNVIGGQSVVATYTI